MSFRQQLQADTTDKKIRDYQSIVTLAKANIVALPTAQYKNVGLWNALCYLSEIPELGVNIAEYGRFEYDLDQDIDESLLAITVNKIDDADELIRNLILQGPTGLAY